MDEFLIFKLFRKDDFKIFIRNFQDRIDNGDYVESDGKETAYILQSTVFGIIDRLEIQGFTVKNSERLFKQAIKNLIKQERSNIVFYKKGLKSAPEFAQHLIEKSNSIITFFKSYSHSEFKEDIYKILTKRISPYWSKKPDLIKDFTDYYKNNETELIYSIEGYHPLYVVRNLLDGFKQKQLVTYDATDVVVGGYVYADYIDFKDVEKTRILTEGSTDTYIIKESLNLLYPHLIDYYHFLDFHSTNNPGGTGNLITAVKSFIGSGIKNNIIALLDNDSAGKEAVMSLKGINMPRNIRVLSYPNIPSAKNFPTIGPTGKKKMNINGLACSIELYLGNQVLRSAKMPQIQWKSLNAKTKTYQGEIQNKSLLFERFKEQIAACKDNPAIINECD